MLHQSTLKFFFPAYQTKALQKERKHRRYRRRTQYSECAGQTRLFVKTHKNPLFDIKPPKKETSAKTTRTRTQRFSGGFLIRGDFILSSIIRSTVFMIQFWL